MGALKSKSLYLFIIVTWYLKYQCIHIAPFTSYTIILYLTQLAFMLLPVLLTKPQTWVFLTDFLHISSLRPRIQSRIRHCFQSSHLQVLICESFSIFPCFSWPWHFYRILVRHFVEYPSNSAWNTQKRCALSLKL